LSAIYLERFSDNSCYHVARSCTKLILSFAISIILSIIFWSYIILAALLFRGEDDTERVLECIDVLMTVAIDVYVSWLAVKCVKEGGFEPLNEVTDRIDSITQQEPSINVLPAEAARETMNATQQSSRGLVPFGRWCDIRSRNTARVVMIDKQFEIWFGDSQTAVAYHGLIEEMQRSGVGHCTIANVTGTTEISSVAYRDTKPWWCYKLSLLLYIIGLGWVHRITFFRKTEKISYRVVKVIFNQTQASPTDTEIKEETEAMLKCLED